MDAEQLSELKLLTSTYTGCKDFELLNPKGDKFIKEGDMVFSRQLLVYYLKTEQGMSNKKAGQQFAIKIDHATVMHSCNVIRNYMETDKTIRKLVNDFIQDAKYLIYGQPEEKEVQEQINSYFLITC